MVHHFNQRLLRSSLAPYEHDVRWDSSPFQHLVHCPPKVKGSRIETILKTLLKMSNSLSTDHDAVLEHDTIEIKGSLASKGSDNKFSFLQIRPDQSYTKLMLATFVFSGQVDVYLIPKQNVFDLIQDGTLRKQHGGNKADSGTYCYNGNMRPFREYHHKSFLISQ
jgi:hypothetical protein